MASGVCVLGLFAALFGGLFLLCRLLCGEAAGLVRELPALAQGLQAPVSRVKTWLIAMAERFPDGLGSGLRAGVESFFKSGAGLGTKLYETLFSWASGVIGKLVSGNITYVLAVYVLDICMVSIDLALTLRNRRLDRLAEMEEAG